MKGNDNNVQNTRREAIKTGLAASLAAGIPVTGFAYPQPATPLAAPLLEGEIALVTGAARGIGQAIAIALARAGADVVALDILEDIKDHSVPMANLSDMKTTQQGVEEAGRRFLSIQADIRDFAAMKAAAQRVQNEWGPIDILIANAGINSNVNFLSDDETAWINHWDTITEVNVKGTANTLRAVLPGMAERKQGKVVITSSTFGRQGNDVNPAYVTSKWGLVGLTKSVAIDAGAHNIKVNAVAPTAVRTGLGGPQTKEARAESDEWLQENYHQLPVGLLEPQAIADAVVFLVSPGAKYITGAVIDVAAGANARYTG